MKLGGDGKITADGILFERRGTERLCLEKREIQREMGAYMKCALTSLLTTPRLGLVRYVYVSLAETLLGRGTRPPVRAKRRFALSRRQMIRHRFSSLGALFGG